MRFIDVPLEGIHRLKDRITAFVVIQSAEFKALIILADGFPAFEIDVETVVQKVLRGVLQKTAQRLKIQRGLDVGRGKNGLLIDSAWDESMGFGPFI